MSRTKLMVGSCFAIALALLAWGCAGTAGNATPFTPVVSKHPANWMPTHYAEYVKDPAQCRTCHGSTADPAQAGGIAKVSCFTCHTSGVNHPANWAAPGQHGRLGAQLPPSTDAKVMAGFAHCAKCHGDDYAGGITAVSCKACHTKAPHPDKPWHGTTATKTNHTAANFNNAAECYKCHKDGANSTFKPLAAPYPGSQPGCFNNTMCHAA